MWLIEELRKAFAGDPPPGKPTVKEYCDLEQERLELELRCEAYRRILLSKGETEASLARKVALYRGARAA